MRIVKILIAIMSLSLMMFSCAEEETVDPLLGTWSLGTPIEDDEGDCEDSDGNAITCEGQVEIDIVISAATYTFSSTFTSTDGTEYAITCTDSGTWTSETTGEGDAEINTMLMVWNANDADTACGFPGGSITSAVYVLNGDQLTLTFDDNVLILVRG